MTDKQLLNLALYALEIEDMACRYEKESTPEHIAKAITAIKQALAAPTVQEPNQSPHAEYDRGFSEGWDRCKAAAQRQWVGLTPSEVDRCWNMTPMDTRNSRHMFVYAIEAKLKEKNT